jgi:hypothetical protein
MIKLLILIFVLVSFSVNALTTKDYGYITINIINQPPRIINISFNPNVVFEDSELICNLTIKDEELESIIYHFEWYKNNIQLNNTLPKLSGFKPGDTIECRAFVEDKYNLSSEEKSVIISVNSTPIRTKLTKSVLNLLGAKTNIEDTLKLEQQGLGAITGYAVKESGVTSKQIPYYFIIFILILIMLININLIFRHRINAS